MRIAIIFMWLILFHNLYSQVNDTVFFTNGKKIIGRIDQIYGKESLKIRSLKGNIYTYNTNIVNKISYHYRREIEAKIELKSKVIINGELEKVQYGNYLIVKTAYNKKVKLFDSEIKSAEINPDYLRKVFIVRVNNKEILWGNLLRENKRLWKLNNISTNQALTISSDDLVKIDSIGMSNDLPNKIIHLISGDTYMGQIYPTKTKYVLFKTLKYGIFLIDKGQILKIDNLSGSSIEIESNNTSQNKNSASKENEINYKAPILSLVKIYAVRPNLYLGYMLNDNNFFMHQLGLDVKYFNKNFVGCASELRIGTSTDYIKINYSINFSPIIVTYTLSPEISIEAFPDIHMRLYSGGSTTNLGFLVGVGYNIKSNYQIKLRMGIDGGHYLGIGGSYLMKNLK